MVETDGEKLTISDLGPVIDVVAQKLPDQNQVGMIVTLCGLQSAVSYPMATANAKQLWVAVFQAALDASQETVAHLLNQIWESLPGSKSLLDGALREVGLCCVSRITRVSIPGLGDQADTLLEASDVPGMQRAAGDLRQTALNIRRLLMRPVLTNEFLRLAPTIMDPEIRRMELADLAVDVVTATDYLLSLLGAPASLSPRLTLDTDAGSDRGHGATDGDALDRLNRRRLDARSTAVRLGMRLLGALRSDVANPY